MEQALLHIRLHAPHIHTHTHTHIHTSASTHTHVHTHPNTRTVCATHTQLRNRSYRLRNTDPYCGDHYVQYPRS